MASSRSLGFRWNFVVDIVGGCNLRCPSCPVGNSDYASVPKGYMTPETLDRICAKAKTECGSPTFCLYNWTEPFLHPNLPAMVETVKKHGLDCRISTNLNIVNNLEALLRAEPNVINVSVSAFNQEKYGVTHRKGDIENVKNNMITLSKLKKKTKSKTILALSFHRYLDNAKDEIEMRKFSEGLGYKFNWNWAYFMPLEKSLEIAEPGSMGVTITDDDRTILERLALPIEEAIEASKSADIKSCELRDCAVALTVRGDAMLCCTAYDQKKFSVGNYLEMPLSEIQKLRNNHNACGVCIRNGYNALAIFQPSEQLNEIAYANVKKAHPDNVHPENPAGFAKKNIYPAFYYLRDLKRRFQGKYSNRQF